LRLVYIIGRFYPYWNGAEIRVKRIAEAMIERGFEVTVLTPRLNRSHPKKEIIFGMTIYRLPKSKLFFFLPRGGWPNIARGLI